MSTFQDILANVLPDSWAASMEAESRGWCMRCPCGAETSIWDMGGVRWKAAGNPVRSGKCAACGRVFMGQIYQRPEVGGQRSDLSQAGTATGVPVVTATVPVTAGRANEGGHWLLWIDGVGCWLLCTKDRLTIGGPSTSSGADSAQIKLLADLSRVHAAIQRERESYWLTATGPATVSGMRAGDRSLLQDQSLIGLGSTGAVQLILRLPNPLSLSARLEFASSHRPARRIDGIVMMEQTCLIGPTADCHIVCPDWEQTVILFRRDGKLWCKAGQGAGGSTATAEDRLFVNGCQVESDAAVRDGSVVTGHELRFRVEFAHAEMG